MGSGYYEYYGSPHHRGWTWQTQAANSITVDGEGQQTRSPEAKGRIFRFATNEYAHYAAGDASLAYSGRLTRFDRHVVFLRPQADDETAVVIFDDLAGAKPPRFEWWLHALEKMTVDERTGTVEIARGNARLQVKFLSPAGMAFTQTDGFPAPPAVRAPPQWHLTAHAAAAADSVFVTVLLPFRQGGRDGLPAVRLIDSCTVEIGTAHRKHLVRLLRDQRAVTAVGRDEHGVVRGRIELPITGQSGYE